MMTSSSRFPEVSNATLEPPAKPEATSEHLDRLHLEDPGSSSTAKDLETGGQQDAVFGTVDDDGPNYRNLSWKGATFLMMKTQIGIGVLTIPKTFDTLGLIPGIIIPIMML